MLGLPDLATTIRLLIDKQDLFHRDGLRSESAATIVLGGATMRGGTTVSVSGTLSDDLASSPPQAASVGLAGPRRA
jgi:hypothetical protein